MRILFAVLAMTVALGACSKKDENQPPKDNKAAVTAPVQQQAANPAPVQQQAAPAPVQQEPTKIVPYYSVKREFTCKNGATFVADFMRSPDQVEITFTGRIPVTMPQKRIQAGFMYESDLYKLVGIGPQAQWTLKGKDPVDCTAKP